MACRVGITTDPDRREKEWRRDCSSLRNWKVIRRGLTREAAQKLEIGIAKRLNCKFGQGGREPETGGSWAVYKFDY